MKHVTIPLDNEHGQPAYIRLRDGNESLADRRRVAAFVAAQSRPDDPGIDDDLQFEPHALSADFWRGIRAGLLIVTPFWVSTIIYLLR